jgi:3'-5' exoribonuclease
MEGARDLRVGDEAHGHFLVTSARNDTTKNGKPYVAFDCRARDGTVFSGCKIWDCKDRPEGVIEIRGPLQEFNGQVHIVAKKWKPTNIDPRLFEPRAPWPLDVKKLYARLQHVLEQIHNSALRDFAKEFLAYWSSHKFPSLEKTSKRFMFHQGVAEHAIQIGELHDINTKEKDLLIVGCLIHDIGKLEEHECINGVYEYTDIGKAYGWSSSAHLFIGSQMLAVYRHLPKTIPAMLTEEECFCVLQNIILSHHGEFGPIKPKYIIAMIAHIADMASSQTNRMRMGLAATDDDEVERDVVRQSYLRLVDYGSVKPDSDEEPEPEPEGGNGSGPEPDDEEDPLAPPDEPEAIPQLELAPYDPIHNERLPTLLDPPYYD